MTYMVRPTMHPPYNRASFSFMRAGSSQLLVGPASSFFAEQIKVRSSTRATSAGLERTRMLLGRFLSLSGMAVPAMIMSRSIAWYSSGDPSHQWTRSGLQSCATSSTQRASFLFLTSPAAVSTSMVVGLDMMGSPCRDPRNAYCAPRRTGLKQRLWNHPVTKECVHHHVQL